MAFKIPKPTYDAKVVAAIEEHLDQENMTEIEHTEEQDGLIYSFARGRHRKSNPRPMFQIINRDAFSCMTGRPRTPCQCDRFDRSWNCPEHPEISWDTERHTWVRPCTGDRTNCECIPCCERRQRAAERSIGYTDMGTDGLRPPLAVIDAYNELLQQSQRCTCPLCQPGQTDGRRLFPVETQEAERRRQYELEQRGRYPDGQPIDWSAIERVPTNLTFNLTGTFDTESFDRRLFPADYRQPFTLEIESETEQGSGPLAIEVEPDSDATA